MFSFSFQEKGFGDEDSELRDSRRFDRAENSIGLFGCESENRRAVWGVAQLWFIGQRDGNCFLFWHNILAG